MLKCNLWAEFCRGEKTPSSSIKLHEPLPWKNRRNLPFKQGQTTHENEKVQFSFTSPDPSWDLLGIKQEGCILGHSLEEEEISIQAASAHSRIWAHFPRSCHCILKKQILSLRSHIYGPVQEDKVPLGLKVMKASPAKMRNSQIFQIVFRCRTRRGHQGHCIITAGYAFKL